MMEKDRIKLYELRKEIISLASVLVQVHGALLALRFKKPDAEIDAAIRQMGCQLNELLDAFKSDSFNE